MTTITRKTFDEVMFKCYNPMQMLITKAHGPYVTDSTGQRYIDLTSGIAVNLLGHTPKGVQKVIKNQIAKLMHCSNIFVNQSTLTLGYNLVKAFDFDRVFFVNSGAEANECALKMARRVAFDKYGPDKNEIISCLNSFHGRTFFSVCVGGHEEYTEGFGPKPAAIKHLPYNDIKAFEETISDKTCCVILEPCEGEGGVIPADPQFLTRIRQLCDQHHAMLIFDEVQTGIGRTGTFFAYQGYGVIPDALTFAKGIGSGLPIGGVLAKDEYALHLVAGTHGSTFGGNPVGCAVGNYILKKVNNEEFLTKVRNKSAYFKEELQRLGQKYNVFKEVRAAGMLLGCELTDQYQGKSSLLQQLCVKNNLLVLLAGSNVLRIAPPLNIKKSVLDKSLKLLEKAIVQMQAQS